MGGRPRIAIPAPHSSNADYVARSLPAYEQAIREAGGEPVVVALELSPDEIARILSQTQGVVLPGSRADVDPAKYDAQPHPRTNAPDRLRDTADELLLQDAFNMRKPVLGICYGMQSLNVWRSGTLVQHLETEVNHRAGRAVERAHKVRIENDSVLADILRSSGAETDPETLEVAVNSSHHQAVERLGDGLRAVARCPLDGVIEAVEDVTPGQFALGVQWHPERSFADDPFSRALFRVLVEAAAGHQ